MKKLLPYNKHIFLILLLCSSLGCLAQQLFTAEDAPEKEEDVIIQSGLNAVKSKVQNTIIWSEDFAGGIPSGWVNQGYNGTMAPSPNALWEYRGPSTTPDNTVGSRGAYASGAPINSPTASNGFIIFDSDFLDNNGLSNNGDNGPAPSPHVGTLTTDVIDLSGYPFVELKMNVYARNFQSEFKVAISNNGGVTFNDTIRFLSTLAANSSTPNNHQVSANISAAAGNSSNVKLMLLYDGRPGNSNNNGLYYWIVDDIILSELPSHAFKFVDLGNAPARDIIFNNGSSPRTGHMPLGQGQPVSFDANIENFGVLPQTDVVLAVDISDRSTGNIIQTLKSQPLPILNSGDTGTFADFFTPNFTFTNYGEYDIIYRVESDSVPSASGSTDAADTVYTLRVTDSIMGFDFGNASNSIGTPQLGDDGSALANRYYFPHATNPVTGKVDVWFMDILFSSLTLAGGDIQIEVYDTAGFEYVAGFGGSPLYSKPFPIGANMPGNLIRFDLSTNGNPLALDPGAYYFVVYMFSNSGANLIRIFNDQAVEQGANSIMYNSTAARWYSGYSSSRNMESPWIRVIAEPVTISLEEYPNQFEIFPNPLTKDVLKIRSKIGGKYMIHVYSIDGKLLLSEVKSNNGDIMEVNMKSLPAGVYNISISNKENSTNKMIIKE